MGGMGGSDVLRKAYPEYAYKSSLVRALWEVINNYNYAIYGRAMKKKNAENAFKISLVGLYVLILPKIPKIPKQELREILRKYRDYVKDPLSLSFEDAIDLMLAISETLEVLGYTSFERIEDIEAAIKASRGVEDED